MPFTARPSGLGVQANANTDFSGISRGIESAANSIVSGIDRRREKAKEDDKRSKSYRNILKAEGIEEISGTGIESAGLDLLEREAGLVLERRNKAQFDAQQAQVDQARQLNALRIAEARDQAAGSAALGTAGRAVSGLPQFSSPFVGPQLREAMRPEFTSGDLMTAVARDPRVARAPEFSALQEAASARAKQLQPTFTPGTVSELPGLPNYRFIRQSPNGAGTAVPVPSPAGTQSVADPIMREIDGQKFYWAGEAWRPLDATNGSPTTANERAVFNRQLQAAQSRIADAEAQLAKGNKKSGPDWGWGTPHQEQLESAISEYNMAARRLGLPLYEQAQPKAGKFKITPIE